MGRIVIVGYKPKPGCQKKLRSLMTTHVPRLRAEGLVTDREPIAMEAADGTIIEVFEWCSKEAIDKAHNNPAVLQMWKEYEAVCNYVPVGMVSEFSAVFSEFSPMEAPT